ncbi:MAG: hypothetical protein IPH24_09680 [Crocinitomicaceae bacterium]|nr:hypothetical protein [Crocinitomicaceae bacterium]
MQFHKTTHQVCISEVYSTGACNSTTGVLQGSLTIAVGDQINSPLTWFLSGYNGTHTIVFTGSAANNVSLPISTNILAPVTVTTPPIHNTMGISHGRYTFESLLYSRFN